jgi:hypothetical protein
MKGFTALATGPPMFMMLLLPDILQKPAAAAASKARQIGRIAAVRENEGFSVK